MIKHLIILLLLTVSSSLASAREFVVNGTFNENSGRHDSFQTGWTRTGFSFFAGHFFAEGSTDKEGMLSQSITGAVGALDLSFDFRASGGVQRVVFDGVTLGTQSGPAGMTRHYAFKVKGSGADTLTFFGRNIPAFSLLSNVSLTRAISPVPEPASGLMMLFGLAIVAIMWRRQVAHNG